MKNNYVALDGTHPVNAGYEGAARIMGGTRLMEVEPVERGDEPFLFVPDFPDLPMEEVYPREDPKGAAVVARETAAGGRVVYIPWNIGEIFWEVMAVDHARLIRNAVLWALGKKPDVVARRAGRRRRRRPRECRGRRRRDLQPHQPDDDEGPGAREHSARTGSACPSPCPLAKRGATARLLIADAEAAVRIEDGRAVLDIPGIDRIEVVHVSWT